MPRGRLPKVILTLMSHKVNLDIIFLTGVSKSVAPADTYHIPSPNFSLENPVNLGQDSVLGYYLFLSLKYTYKISTVV